MKKLIVIAAAAAAAAALLLSCSSKKTAEAASEERDSTWTTVNHPDWSRNAVIYEVNMRQYTDSGTVAAFAKELPRLKDLGVDILWFMPINPISEKDRKGSLGSYYAVKNYKEFNPEYGTLDEFKDLVKQAHSLGMKIILDWVPNHSGRDNVWVTEHPDWYERDEQGNMKGVYDWTDVYVFDYSNPEMRKGMIDAMSFWLKDVDVDGFRCDVAMEVPTDFWNECRKALEGVKPDMFMLAEASVPELEKEAFDMAYNWPMKDLFNEIAATAGQNTYKNDKGESRTYAVKHAAAIDSLLADQAKNYPKDSYMMNMVTNHDLNSWEGTEFQRLGNLTDAFAVLSYTLPGMPLIYTGQETGLNRAFKFFDKDKAPEWEPRNKYFDFYKKLNTLKHDQKALRAGVEGGELVSYKMTSPDIYAFSREKDGSKVVVVVNLGKEAAEVKAADNDLPALDNMTDFFKGAAAEMPATLNPGEYRVFTGK